MDGFARLQESHYATQSNPQADPALKQILERLASRFLAGGRRQALGNGELHERRETDPVVCRLRAQQEALARLGRDLPVGPRLMRRVLGGREVDTQQVHKVVVGVMGACGLLVVSVHGCRPLKSHSFS